jgi:DNA-binding response OmpR family regulator
MRLLVVEDDPVVGKALRQGFAEASCECQWVRDGERSLELAKSQQFDAIVLDIMLPKLGGLEVLSGASTNPCENSSTNPWYNG